LFLFGWIVCFLCGVMFKNTFAVGSFSTCEYTERWIWPFRLPSMFWWQWASIQHWQPSLFPIVVLVFRLRRRSWHLHSPPPPYIRQLTHAHSRSGC
jgi:hypothetical protein